VWINKLARPIFYPIGTSDFEAQIFNIKFGKTYENLRPDNKKPLSMYPLGRPSRL
jgi:hypothetical protein